MARPKIEPLTLLLQNERPDHSTTAVVVVTCNHGYILSMSLPDRGGCFIVDRKSQQSNNLTDTLQYSVPYIEWSFDWQSTHTYTHTHTRSPGRTHARTHAYVLRVNIGYFILVVECYLTNITELHAQLVSRMCTPCKSRNLTADSNTVW